MLYYSSIFQDIDLLKESVIDWNLEVFPLEATQLKYQITQAMSPYFLIGEGNFNCKTEQNGLTPKDFKTFVIPAHDLVHYYWRGKNLTGQQISLFPPNGELHSISNNSFHVYTLSFHNSLIDKNLEIFKNNKLERALKTENVWKIDTIDMQNIRHLSAMNLHCMSTKKPFTLLSEQLLTKIMGAISKTEGVSYSKQIIQDHLLVKKVSEWVRFNKYENTPLNTLYDEIDFGERKIQETFKRKFDISIKTYYNHFRLSRVHQLLKVSNKRSIRDIAAEYGFWHMSQFSKDYKKIYGELPSQTLLR